MNLDIHRNRKVLLKNGKLKRIRGVYETVGFSEPETVYSVSEDGLTILIKESDIEAIMPTNYELSEALEKEVSLRQQLLEASLVVEKIKLTIAKYEHLLK
jgi:hypothetical protein